MSRYAEAEGQLAFDIEGMIHAAEVEAAPPWTGAPLHFTVDYYRPSDLDAAFAHWQFLNRGVLGSYAASRMWHRAIAVPGDVQVGDHGFDMFTADLRCNDDDHRHGNCSCLGDLVYQSVCEPCDWHAITDGENKAVEAWHDHAIPGWRDLPIVPARIKMCDSSMRPSSRPVNGWRSTTPKPCGSPARRSSPNAPTSGTATFRADHRGRATTSPTPLSIPTG